jgi:hypothetical protein
MSTDQGISMEASSSAVEKETEEAAVNADASNEKAFRFSYQHGSTKIKFSLPLVQ